MANDIQKISLPPIDSLVDSEGRLTPAGNDWIIRLVIEFNKIVVIINALP